MKTRKTTFDKPLKPCLNADGASCPCNNFSGEYDYDPVERTRKVMCENYKMHEAPPERRAKRERAAQADKANATS